MGMPSSPPRILVELNIKNLSISLSRSMEPIIDAPPSTRRLVTDMVPSISISAPKSIISPLVGQVRIETPSR